ncbi:unnamed protein product, partial [Rotaria magnacalcarata]
MDTKRSLDSIYYDKTEANAQQARENKTSQKKRSGEDEDTNQMETPLMDLPSRLEAKQSKKK